MIHSTSFISSVLQLHDCSRVGGDSVASFPKPRPLQNDAETLTPCTPLKSATPRVRNAGLALGFAGSCTKWLGTFGYKPQERATWRVKRANWSGVSPWVPRATSKVQGPEYPTEASALRMADQSRPPLVGAQWLSLGCS